eukprot:scaffold246_cov364-Pavlova_lutheri.AAC.13
MGPQRTHGPAHTGRLRGVQGRSFRDACHRSKRCVVRRRTTWIEDSELGSAFPGQGGGKRRSTPTTPPPLFLHRERGAVAVGSVEPPEDLSSRCSSNRSCRALRVEGFVSMDPDL